MEELTIEEKAARYDEAINIARKINNGEGVATPSGWTTCEVIFPELKESEDERIRKNLIKIVNDHYSLFKEIDRTKTIVWLEKQGEHANFRNKIQVGDKVTRNEDGVLVNMSQLKRVAKPADKIEPKFKVGDLVVDGIDMIYQIKEIKGSKYLLQCYNSNDVIPVKISTIDNDCHLWTINDAKDGDVLVCPKYANDIIPNIFIFKNIATKDNDVFCYCSFLKTFMTGGYVANADPINTDFYPATKEQRDTLMKAIADAGYTFDFEKKELKKIEQNPAWSEEDESMLNNIIEDFGDGKTSNMLQEYWLKSLKDRVQSKVEWSEKDENYINDLIKYFSQNEKLKNTKEDIVSWLKSLRPQNRWKPSDEQLKSLKGVIDVGYFTSYPGALETLYEQLKQF